MHCSWFHYDRIFADVIDIPGLDVQTFASKQLCVTVWAHLGLLGYSIFCLESFFILLTFKEHNE